MIIDGHHHIVDDCAPILARMDALGIDRTVLVGVGVRDISVVTIRDSVVFRSHLLLRTLGILKARLLVRSRALRANLLPEPRNDAALRAIEAHPARFCGFVFLNPESPRALDELERCVAAGMCGVKLALVQYPTDLGGERMAKLCTAARKHRLPIFIHQGLTRASSDLAPLLRRFPETPFIAAHTGVQCFRQVMTLALRYENLFIDTSSHIATVAKLQRLCDTLGASRLIFGSDTPVMCSDPEHALRKIRALHVSDDDKARILGRNLAALLPHAVGRSSGQLA